MLGMRFPMGRVLAGPRGAALSLDFVTPGASLDSRITFSRASAATYFDAAGLLTTAASGVPRFDHDPSTLAPRGLLVEETRTNLLLRSQEMDNAAWSKVRSSITANATAAPDGTLTADKLVEDATAANTHDLRQSLVKSASSITYSVSAFVKAAERTWCFLWLYGASQSNRGEAWFDIASTSAGTVQTQGTGFSGATSAVQSMGGGWLRGGLTVASNTDTTLGLLFGTAVANANSQTNGDGVSGLYAWGSQIEVGAYPTSYIPTTSATATRAADLATISLGTVPVDFSAFSFMHAFVHYGAATILTLSDGTSTEVVRLVVSAATLRLQVVDGGSTVADIALGAVSVGAAYRVAARIAANDVAASVNGAAVVTDTSVTVPTLTTLTFGQAWHRQLSLYAGARSDTFIQQVTA